MSLIKCKNVSLAYDGVTVVKNLDLNLIKK